MKIPYRMLATLLLSFVSGCGGSGVGLAGPSLAETGVGGSGGVAGPVQGFGSIIINDLVMNVDSAEFVIEGMPAGLGLTGQNLLSEGQQLVVRGDLSALNASQVFYRSDIKGPLSAAPAFDPLTGAGRLSMLGQTIRVNAATRYENTALDTMLQGALLEISGTRSAQGELIATYVGQQASLEEYKVVGRVTAHTALGFSIEGLAVDVQSIGLSVPEVGQLVEVRLARGSFAPGEPVPALAVDTLEGISVEPGEEFEIQGYVDTFTSSGQFTVNGVPVIASAATQFEDSDPEDLRLDAHIEVEGTANRQGAIEADEIIFRSTEAVRVEGTVVSTDLSARTLTTDAGLTFDIRQLTELEDDSALEVEPLTLEDLGSGDFVEVVGFLDGRELVAAEVERLDADSSRPHRLRAPADGAPGINADGEVELSILGQTVLGAQGITAFQAEDGTPLSASEFASLVTRGTPVEATWESFTGDVTLIASSLVIEGEEREE